MITNFINGTQVSNGHIILDSADTLEQQNHRGLQHKGIVNLDGHHVYLKLDELSPRVTGEWEDKFDYKYSSVSETLASLFVKNLKVDPQFDSAMYQFRTIGYKNTNHTGTASEIYLRENEIEEVLSTGHTNNKDATRMTLKDYASKIYDTNHQERFKNLINSFVESGVPKDHAKHFIIQQTAFDMILGNKDRLSNPSNFVIAYNAKTNIARPINIDFGRCLQLDTWSQTTENALTENHPYYDESLDDFTDYTTKSNDSLLDHLKFDKAKDFLDDNGYQPFELNVQALHADVTDFVKQLEQSRAPFINFAKMKAAVFIKTIEKQLNNGLVLDKSKEMQKQVTKSNQKTTHQIDMDF